MLYTDRVKDAIAVLKTDLEEMNDLSSDPEMDRAISDLKVHLDDFLDACTESLEEQEEEEEGEAELFDLRHRQLVGLAEEIAVLTRKRPEQPEPAIHHRQECLIIPPFRSICIDFRCLCLYAEIAGAEALPFLPSGQLFLRAGIHRGGGI
jgi:hypothetical protein